MKQYTLKKGATEKKCRKLERTYHCWYSAIIAYTCCCVPALGALDSQYKLLFHACAPHATAPATLPAHTSPLNHPRSGSILFFTPPTAHRQNHTPLYRAARANSTVCTTCELRGMSVRVAAWRANVEGGSSVQRHEEHAPRRSIRQMWLAATAEGCGLFGRCKPVTN